MSWGIYKQKQCPRQSAALAPYYWDTAIWVNSYVHSSLCYKSQHSTWHRKEGKGPRGTGKCLLQVFPCMNKSYKRNNTVQCQLTAAHAYSKQCSELSALSLQHALVCCIPILISAYTAEELKLWTKRTKEIDRLDSASYGVHTIRTLRQAFWYF